MKIAVEAIATVSNTRKVVEDDDWGEVVSTITLREDFPTSAFDGIGAFSHLTIVFYFHLVQKEKIKIGSRHPRGNVDWPLVGTFAQRHKNRPNQIGLTTVEIVEHKGREILVRGLDAIHGTPVIDIKPVMKEFLPKGEVQQPPWCSELMKNYW